MNIKELLLEGATISMEYKYNVELDDDNDYKKVYNLRDELLNNTDENTK